MIGAFFDMDRTLLSRSSTLLWIRYMWKHRELPPRLMASLGWILLRYRLGKLDVPAMTRQLVAGMAGEAEAGRIEFTRRWFADQLVHYVAEEGRRCIEQHHRQGHYTALITASPVYTAEPVAEYVQIPSDAVLATRFEVKEGRFTGQLIEPMCYREGKLLWAEEFATRRGIDLQASYFYTDSIDDLPLLERVGSPVAVNPDKQLRKLAELRGWPIIRFY